MVLIDSLGPIRDMLSANPVAEALVLARGIHKYGSATGAGNSGGVMCFGWNMLHLLGTPLERLALLHNDCRRPGFGYYDERPVDERSADPAKGSMPTGVEVPEYWWQDWIGADHQHDLWAVMWLASALVAEREKRGGRMNLAFPGAPWPLDAEQILLLRLAAHADAAAGIARNAYLLSKNAWSLPDGTLKVNPDPSARGYAGPLLAALIAKLAGAPISAGDEADIMAYLTASLDCYDAMPFSHFSKHQSAVPPVTTPYFIPAQEVQLAVAWDAYAKFFRKHGVHPMLEIRCNAMAQRQLELLVPWVNSTSDFATPWVVSLRDTSGKIPKPENALPVFYQAHRAPFDPSAWMMLGLKLAVDRGIPDAEEQLGLISYIREGPNSEIAWAATPIWEEL